MGIQAFVPSGGGGTPGFDYIASVRMETYNRSWTQAGAAGNYIITSNVNNSGYAYFVGATTTGTPLNKVVNITHSFTRIDIVAPTNDYISLFKAAVKSTTVFANPFANFASFPSTITSSGNFVLPTSALPLVNAIVVGGGGGGGGHHGGGGGGGGGVIKLEGYQAVGTTSVTIGGGGSGGSGHGSKGGDTYFGNVFSYGGTGGSGSGNGNSGGLGANGGGASGHGGQSQSSHLDSATQQGGRGTQSGTATWYGGNAGGNRSGHRGGGGGGAGGNGGNGSGDPTHGAGHTWNITGTNYEYALGGFGAHHSGDGYGSHDGRTNHYGTGGHGVPSSGAGTGGQQGVVIVRYYIT